MKYILKSVCFCLAICAAAACSNENEPIAPQGSGEPIILDARIEQPHSNRTIMEGTDLRTTTWAVGDKVCLSGTASLPDTNGNGNDKMIDLGPGFYEYKVNGSWNYTDGATQPIIWKASEIKVSGVFPATDVTGTQVTNKTFTLGTDQQTAAKQGNNDYMTADEALQKASENNKPGEDNRKVTLTFKHQLAQLAITIASIGTELNGATISKVEVRSNTVLRRTWSDPAYITACGATTGQKNDVYIALVAPEKPDDISPANPFIKVTLSDGKVVNLSTLPSKLTFEKGQQHTLALHVGHDEITVDAAGITIGGWGANTNVTGDTPADTEEESERQ